MDDLTKLATSIFKHNNVTVPPEKMGLLHRFLEEASNSALMNEIVENENRLMKKWQQQERIADIIQQPLRIPNATVGKPYEAPLDAAQYWQDVTSYTLSGLEEVGLRYNDQTKTITGVPTKSGDIPLSIQFNVEGEPEDAAFHEKPLTLIINPDPKSLWKNIESDKGDPYWKEDNKTVFAPIGDRHILVSSKRGRSHANTGGFREDDFGFSELANGWCIITLSDGAGSARLSRKGSALACQTVIDTLREATAGESMTAFDDILLQYHRDPAAESEKSLNRFVYNTLGKAAFAAHKALEEFAKNEKATIKDLSATLVFCLWKKYEAGYALLSFGVGDCPVALLNKDVSEVILMNWLDVGEFGGGTRFITMPEIFQSDKFATRFSFKLVADFSYLVLMSDGIYDPKFVVEAALPNIAKWKEFLADLDGNNPEGVKVELRADNGNIEEQFSRWMDFWSPGNHDDRTLAIVF